MKDSDPQIRIQAIRASETLYKPTPGDKTFANDYRALTKDTDPNVVIQAMLTLNLLRVPQAADVVRALRDTHGARGVKEIAPQVLQPQASRGQPASNDAGAGYLNLTPADRKTLLAGESRCLDRRRRSLCASRRRGRRVPTSSGRFSSFGCTSCLRRGDRRLS